LRDNKDVFLPDEVENVLLRAAVESNDGGHDAWKRRLYYYSSSLILEKHTYSYTGCSEMKKIYNIMDIKFHKLSLILIVHVYFISVGKNHTFHIKLSFLGISQRNCSNVNVTAHEVSARIRDVPITSSSSSSSSSSALLSTRGKTNRNYDITRS